MPKYALVTYNKLPQLSESDKLLSKYLTQNHILTESVIWDDNRINWTVFETIIIRSCWDYYFKLSDFIPWLYLLKKLNLKVWNNIDIILWNLNKKYLYDLQNKGVEIIPSIFINKSNLDSLIYQIKANLWPHVIIKPAVGASCYGIRKFSSHQHQEIIRFANKLLQNNLSIVVQKFITDISEGEFSLIFIGNKFSHAVLKKPQVDDYRTSINYGGTEQIIKADNKLISFASNVVKIVNSKLLFARIDLVISNTQILLMELELIEPHLFFDLNPEAARKFVKLAISLAL